MYQYFLASLGLGLAHRAVGAVVGDLLAPGPGAPSGNPPLLEMFLAGFALLAVYALPVYFLWKGFGLLRLYRPGYSLGLTGAKLVIAGLASVTLAGAMLVLAASCAASPGCVASAAGVFAGVFVFAALALTLIGIVAGFAGLALETVALWRLGGEPGGSPIRAGIVLWLAGLPLGFSSALLGDALWLAGSLLGVLGARRLRGQAAAREEAGTV
ncbi:hypothetical protein [Pyrodictium delaneyi]|uniref:hypothetical protein n=1 Tax=Pyrodictium delaneyi TaxID=1273541 RepID=UPI0012E2118E|nr:hypothetical protein [Pyrodictium delaneyi]